MSDARTFSEAEVDAILKLAIARQDQGGGLSRDELREVVSQLGITGEALDEAIAEHDDQMALASQAEAWKRDRLRRLGAHAAVYGAVILGLAVLNLLTSPGALWFLWPALGWGVALAAEYAAVRRGPDPEALEAHHRIVARRTERARKKAEKAERARKQAEQAEALKRASEELGDAVKAGVTGLLENLGRSLREVSEASAAPSETRTRVRVSNVAPPPEVSEEEIERELEAMRKKKRGR